MGPKGPRRALDGAIEAPGVSRGQVDRLEPGSGWSAQDLQMVWQAARPPTPPKLSRSRTRHQCGGLANGEAVHVRLRRLRGGERGFLRADSLGQRNGGTSQAHGGCGHRSWLSIELPGLGGRGLKLSARDRGAALAHVVGDATERAYRRGDALEKRRKLEGMGWISDASGIRFGDVRQLRGRLRALCAACSDDRTRPIPGGNPGSMRLIVRCIFPP